MPYAACPAGYTVGWGRIQPAISPKRLKKAKVTVNSLYKGVQWLLIAAKTYDLEWPLSEIKGHWFLKCRKNVEIQLSNDRRHVEWLGAVHYIPVRRRHSCTYLLTQLARAYEAGNISETVEDRAKVTIRPNGLYKVPPKCMTLKMTSDRARFKVIDSLKILKAAKMAKYSLVMMTPTVCTVLCLW